MRTSFGGKNLRAPFHVQSSTAEMLKKVLVTIGASRIIISAPSGPPGTDVATIKNAIFKEAERNASIRSKFSPSASFILQKYCEEFDEFVDLNGQDPIEDKSKLNVVFLDGDESQGNGQQGSGGSPLFPIVPPSKGLNSGPMPFGKGSFGGGPGMSGSRFGGPGMMNRPSFGRDAGMPPSLPMPPVVEEFDRLKGNRQPSGSGLLGPGPRFQGGGLLGMTQFGSGGNRMGGPSRFGSNVPSAPPPPGISDDTDGFDFSRPFHEQRRSPHMADDIIHLESLLSAYDRRSRSPSPEYYRRRSRSHSPRRRYSPPSSRYRNRDYSPDYGRDRWSYRDRSRSPDRRYRYHEDDYYPDRDEDSFRMRGLNEERYQERPSHGRQDDGKKTKYTWDQVLEWEDDELGFKYKEPPSVREIYAAAENIRTKQPVQLLNEQCQKKEWKQPVFTLTVDGTGTKEPIFQFKVEVDGKTFEAERYSQNKKQAKVYAAIKALYELKFI